MYYLTVQSNEKISLPGCFRELVGESSIHTEENGSVAVLACADMSQAAGILSALARAQVTYRAAHITARRPGSSALLAVGNL